MSHSANPSISPPKQLLCDPQSVTSGILHFIGMGIAIAGLVLLLLRAAVVGGAARISAFAIYGASSILLFAASGVYHTFYVSARVHRALRKLDHCMIYFLIAGTYTPLCLVSLQGWQGWLMFGLIWALGIAGMVLKLVWLEAPRRLSTLSYLLMGWVALLAVFPLYRSIGAAGLAWLFGGGAVYSLGAVCYHFRIPKINFRYFGDHELFHVLIIIAWLCHYQMMLRCVV